MFLSALSCVFGEVCGPSSFHRQFKARMLPGAKAGDYGGFIKPQLATIKRQIPTGKRWVHEIKFDGYRIQAHLVAGKVHLYTRTALDWTKRFAPIAEGIGRLKANHLIIDGEIVSEVNGAPSFLALQEDLSTGRDDRMLFYVFDLLFMDGFDIRAATLLDRKSVLEPLVAELDHPRIRYSEHWENGVDLYREACRRKIEGTISKLIDEPYRSTRVESWVKNKCVQRATFPIVGFIPDAARGIAALRLAKRNG